MRVPRFVIAVVYSLSERSFRKSFSSLYTVVVNCAFQESPEVFLTHSALPPACWLFACIWRRDMDIFLQGHTERHMYLSLSSTRRVQDLTRVFMCALLSSLLFCSTLTLYHAFLHPPPYMTRMRVYSVAAHLPSS